MVSFNLNYSLSKVPKKCHWIKIYVFISDFHPLRQYNLNSKCWCDASQQHTDIIQLIVIVTEIVETHFFSVSNALTLFLSHIHTYSLSLSPIPLFLSLPLFFIYIVKNWVAASAFSILHSKNMKFSMLKPNTCSLYVWI